MTNAPTHLLIPTDLAQSIADYLATRPFREVAGFMGALQQLKPPAENAPPPPVEEATG